MPSSSVVLKSRLETKPRAQIRIPSEGTILETTITTTESSAPIRVRPIVCGSLTKRALSVLSTAASTITIAAASKGERSDRASFPIGSKPYGRRADGVQPV